MLKNYPAIHLFLLSLVAVLLITWCSPIVGSWNIYCSVVADILKFTSKVVFFFFSFCALIEMTHGLFFRNRHH